MNESVTMPFTFNLFEQITLGLMIVIFMFTIGTGLDLEELKKSAINKKAIVTVLFCQYGLMPFLAYLAFISFKLPLSAFFTLIIVTSSPGGTSSNIFTYLSGGNLALSVSLSIVSTFFSLIFSPLIISLYLSFNNDFHLTIPYFNLITTFIGSLIPIILGAVLKIKYPSFALTLDKTMKKIGLIIMIIMVVIWIPKLYNYINKDQFLVFFSAVFICTLGISLSMILSKAFKISFRDAIAIGFETGIQNAPLSYAIIILSFASTHVIHQHSWLALIYGAVSVGVSLLITAGIQCVYIFKRRTV